MAARWLSGGPGHWRLSLQVQPGAAASASCGEHGGRLRLRIAAPPIEGRANEALIDYLSRTLGVPRRALRIAAGAGGRRKTVALDADLQAAEVQRLLSG